MHYLGRGKTVGGVAWFRRQVIWACSRRLYHVLASSSYCFPSVFSSKWCELFRHIFIDRMNWNLWTTFSKNALLIGSLTTNRLQSPQLLPCSLEPGAARSCDDYTWGAKESCLTESWKTASENLSFFLSFPKTKCKHILPTSTIQRNVTSLLDSLQDLTMTGSCSLTCSVACWIHKVARI